MDLQTSALVIIALLALITIFYFAAQRFLAKIETVSGTFTRITQSCYRMKVSGTTDMFTYKAGFLLLSNKVIQISDIKKVTAILGSSSGEGKFAITEKALPVPPYKTYFLNAVCPIKKTLSGPEFPVYNTPGADLTFSIRIDFSDGTNDQIDDIKIIPIDIEPC